MRLKARFKEFQERHLMKLTLAVMIAGLLFAFFSPRMIVIVPAGHVGVLFRPLAGGTDTTLTMREGAHLIAPWNDLTLYDARLQTVNEVFNVITSDGLHVEADIEFRYRVNRELIGEVHRALGRDYLKVMLTPEVAAHAREVVAQYDAEDFYSRRRSEVQSRIFQHVVDGIKRTNSYSGEGVTLVYVDDILIKGIKLPPVVAAAIERKVEQYHRQLEFDFRLQTEEKEARRKAIEGSGVAQLFANVGARDVQSYLRLASIEAMLKMAQSGNAKTIIVADPRGGTPIILNPDAGADAAAAGSARTPPGSAPAAAPGPNALRP